MDKENANADENENVSISETKVAIESNKDLELKGLPSHLNKKPRFSMPSEQHIKDDLKNANKLALMRLERSKSLDPTQKLDGFDPVRKRISSIMSLGQWGAINLEDNYESGPW